MLFKNAKTCIITNGFISKYVTISRSSRQGCPIVPMLYILHAEPLALIIKHPFIAICKLYLIVAENYPWLNNILTENSFISNSAYN
jgi:hypothetical protein